MRRVLIFLMMFGFVSCGTNYEKQISKALNYQVKNYPESRLVDIYKNFFQDFYGPGHLMSNRSTALEYLRGELEYVDGKSQKNLVESTGYKSMFVRVDLSVVKDGTISFDDFADAFIRSGELFTEPDIGVWKEEWKNILSVVEKKFPDIPGLESDKKKLDEMLGNGEYVVHHSKEYIEAYNPHYRIIGKEIFDRELLSFFK